MNGTDPRTAAPLNPTQRETFDALLAVGGERPYAPANLCERLRDHLAEAVAPALARWTEPTLWLSKGALFSVRTCEGAFVADRAEQASAPAGGGTLSLNTAVGTVTHRAIQILHTHPGMVVEDVVRSAVEGSRAADPRLAEFWDAAGTSGQSDLLVQATSRTMGLLDSWPALHPSWAPRFEEPIQAKVGKLTLSGRVDLLLGRPRPDGKQTMVIADWKSGGLKDDHQLEAAFYALLATLRFGVPPFRSTIYSLASGTWTDPDVTPESLFAAADWVAGSVHAIVDTLTEARTPELTPSAACSWCPARETCPVGPAAQLDGTAHGNQTAAAATEATVLPVPEVPAPAATEDGEGEPWPDEDPYLAANPDIELPGPAPETPTPDPAEPGTSQDATEGTNVWDVSVPS